MLRDQWKFRYTAEQLAEAVQQKIQYHDERHAFWNGRREDIVTQIKADGIEVNEKSVLQYASPKMRDYQQGGDIMIRNDLRKSLTEAYEKLAYYTGRKDTYDGWRHWEKNADAFTYSARRFMAAWDNPRPMFAQRVFRQPGTKP
jgi:hypothetical protein